MMHHDDAAPATGASAGDTPAPTRKDKLNDAQREYIVRRLAAYERPCRIRREVRERFGIEVSQTAIQHYDPTRSAACGREWADLFYAARRAYVGEQSGQTSKDRKVERVVLRAIEIVTERILRGVQAEAQVGAEGDEITDDDRLRALIAFIEQLKITNPQGIAHIRRALFDDRSINPKNQTSQT